MVTVYQQIMKVQEGARYQALCLLLCLLSGIWTVERLSSYLAPGLFFLQGLSILISGSIHGKYVLISADVSFQLVYNPSLKQLLLLTFTQPIHCEDTQYSSIMELEVALNKPFTWNQYCHEDYQTNWVSGWHQSCGWILSRAGVSACHFK